MKEKQENNDSSNIVPLGSDEIKSILKSQSDSIFEDKNISNNSNFVKKSLIDIALDFETKQNVNENEAIDDTLENNNNLEEKNNIATDEYKTEEVMLDENEEVNNRIDIQGETEQSTNEKEINDTSKGNLDKIEEDLQSEKLEGKESFTDLESDSQKQSNETTVDTNSNEISKSDNATQQALDSVRDAVSQSMNKNEDVVTKSLEENTSSTDNVSETILEDYEKFKNILSSLSTLGEEAIYEVFQNKIFEISYELAGYQIDKMPDKYEKKIKSFLKNINCYEDKITIEVNDKDFEALLKIKNFNKNEEKKIFVSNKELSRGDIILNCDGMRYSEKGIYNRSVIGNNL